MNQNSVNETKDGGEVIEKMAEEKLFDSNTLTYNFFFGKVGEIPQLSPNCTNCTSSIGCQKRNKKRRSYFRFNSPREDESCP